MESLALKTLFVIPILFIVDYMAMIMVGCISYLFGFTSNFISVGKVVMIISLVVLIMALATEIKALVKKRKVS